MRKALNILFFGLLLITLICSCSDDEGVLVNKWQLCRYEYSNGAVQKEDSVFYNFMKGSFSAICLLSDGEYTTFYGNYVYKDNELQITLLPESLINPFYNRYMKWESGERVFHIDELTSSTLKLNYKGEKTIFRKY